MISNNTLTLNSGLQYFQFAGAEIAFDYQCAVENPTHLLVLVNGYQRTRLDFRAFRKKLSPHIATIALDNRYCGETKIIEQVEPFSVEVMAKDVYAIACFFMQKLNLKSFSLLGISMGGMVVQTLASLLPSFISAQQDAKLDAKGILDNLFLVSTTCGGVGRTWPRPVDDPTKLKYENKNIDLESTKKNMSRYFADKFLQNSPLLFEMMCKNILKNSISAGDDLGVSEQYRVSAHYDGASLLNKISAKKTVVFSGDEDKIIPVGNAYYLHNNIQNSELIIYPQVGHLILIEEPEQFVKDVASFFL